MRLTDVVDGAGAELAVELLGAEAAEVVYGERPEVEHVVAGEGVPLLDHDHLAAQQGQLDGCAQTAGPAADDQTLHGSNQQKKMYLIIWPELGFQ